MDFESPDVAKEFPGLYASDSLKRSQSHGSDYSDSEKTSRKDKEKKKERKESKKDKGYVAFEEESSGGEDSRSPGKGKKNRLSSFKFRGIERKEKNNKSKDKESKEKKKDCKEVKECKEAKEYKNDPNAASKKKKSKLSIIKDKKKKSTVSEEIQDEKPVFGVPLHVAVERSKSLDGIEVPIVVRECIDYIEEHGLSCEGIYRISGLKSKLRKLKSQYNRAEKVYLYEHEPHIVANLLKLFLHDLPEPILTSELTPHFEEAAVVKNPQKRIEILQDLMNKLPNCNRVLLSWIIVHMMHVAALDKRNKMNLQNISIILSPTLKINHYILHAFFMHSDALFKGIEIKKYISPVELDTSRLSVELPDSPSAIADELSKQENILNILHDELNAGLRDKKKEEELWEIQRIVTQLKRKLRFVNHLKNSTNVRSDTDNKNEDFSLNTVIEIPLDAQLTQCNSNASKEEILKEKTDVTNSFVDISAKEFSTGNSETSISDSTCNKSSVIISSKPLKLSLSLKDGCTSSKIDLAKNSTVCKSKSEEVLTQSGCLKKPFTLPPSVAQDSADHDSNFEESTKIDLEETNEIVVLNEKHAYSVQDNVLNNNTTNENMDLQDKKSDSTNVKNIQDLSSLVESMIKTYSYENLLKEMSKYAVYESKLHSPNEFNECDEEKYFATQIYLNTLGDELVLLRNDLKRKKNSEVFEIERLKQEINESFDLLKYKQYSFDSAPLLISSSSTENSSSNSEHSSASDCDEEECDSYSVLEELIEENKQLKLKSQEYLKLMEKEREKNVNVKVLMKMLQTMRRLKSSTS